MLYNLKNLSLLLIVIIGFFIFLTNIIKLNLNNKNFLLSTNINKNKTIHSNKENFEVLKKEKNLNETKTEKNILLNNVLKNDTTKQNEIIIKVKKGQTFSEILDNFKYKNNKFEIINSINKIFNLRNLKINQGRESFKNILTYQERKKFKEK